MRPRLDIAIEASTRQARLQSSCHPKHSAYMLGLDEPRICPPPMKSSPVLKANKNVAVRSHEVLRAEGVFVRRLLQQERFGHDQRVVPQQDRLGGLVQPPGHGRLPLPQVAGPDQLHHKGASSQSGFGLMNSRKRMQIEEEGKFEWWKER